MFFGEYKHSCDSKNRLRIPSKFKKNVDCSFVLIKGNDGCLFIVTKNQFEVIVNKVENLPIFNGEIQKPIRMLFSSAVEIEEDSQGRFLLPNTLKTFANINKEVVFIGVGNRIELWAAEKWEKYSKELENNFEKVLMNLGEYGI